MKILDALIERFRVSPISSTCALVFGLFYYIYNNPTSIDFLGPDIAKMVLDFSALARGTALVVMMWFVADSKPEEKTNAQKIKDVIDETPMKVTVVETPPPVEKSKKSVVKKKVQTKKPK